MNDFCFPFDHDFKFPSIDQLYSSGKEIHKILNLDFLDKSFLNWLHSIDLKVGLVEASYKEPQSATIKNSKYGIIHADGNELDNKCKINYIIGGRDSQMIWYKNKNIDSKGIRSFTPGSTNIIRPYTNQLDEVHRQGFKTALVNVGVFHGIENTVEPRIAIQCVIRDSKDNRRVDFFDARDRIRKSLKI